MFVIVDDDFVVEDDDDFVDDDEDFIVDVFLSSLGMFCFFLCRSIASFL